MRAMKTLAAGTILILLSAWTPQDEPGFVPLFNGRTLDGWVNVNCAPGTCGSSFPTWSPDGEFLSFSSNRPGGAGGWDIYISDVDPQTGDALPPFALTAVNTQEFEHAARWSR